MGKLMNTMKIANLFFILMLLFSFSLQNKIQAEESLEESAEMEEQTEEHTEEKTEEESPALDPYGYEPWGSDPNTWAPQPAYIPQPPAIEICGATYFNRDVTGTVRSLFNNGQRSFSASNSVFGDPRRGTVKSLTIVYRRGGQYITRSVAERAGSIHIN